MIKSYFCCREWNIYVFKREICSFYLFAFEENFRFNQISLGCWQSTSCPILRPGFIIFTLRVTVDVWKVDVVGSLWFRHTCGEALQSHINSLLLHVLQKYLVPFIFWSPLTPFVVSKHNGGAVSRVALCYWCSRGWHCAHCCVNNSPHTFKKPSQEWVSEWWALPLCRAILPPWIRDGPVSMDGPPGS